jgi:4-amino-4-deoxy-L-arabinose transferase-like glycosyltransferase
VSARMREVDRREWLLVLALATAGVVLRVVITLLTEDARLLGDQPEYHASGMLFTDGKPFWGLAPLGYAHESLWKAPLYGAWVGVVYTVLGNDPVRVEVVQGLIGGLTILLTWLLARRLFGRGVAIAAAAIVTVYPLAWQFGAELFPEALAVPLVTFTLWLFLAREPTGRRAAAVGAAMGVNLLLRPTSIALFAAILVAFLVAAGWRRGILMTALSVAVAALVVAPWTIRNAVVADAFVPISVQDAAIHGTFNETSASDPTQPYAWRAITPFTLQLLRERPRPDEIELRRRLYDEGLEYVRDHPSSVPKAFFWNGITRFWDVRRPSHVLDEAQADGRRRKLTGAGLVMYWVLLPLAIFGLWRLRRRREIVLPVLALALASSAVYTIDSGTRYRAPLEPLIVILACTPFAARLDRYAGRVLPAAQPQPASA